MNVEATLAAMVDPKNGLVTIMVRRISELNNKLEELAKAIGENRQVIEELRSQVNETAIGLNELSKTVSDGADKTYDTLNSLDSYVGNFANDVMNRLAKLESAAPAKRSRKKKEEPAAPADEPTQIEEPVAEAAEPVANDEPPAVPFARADGEIIDAEVVAAPAPDACPPVIPADRIRAIRNDIKVLGSRDFVAVVNADLTPEQIDWALSLTDEQLAQYGAN